MHTRRRPVTVQSMLSPLCPLLADLRAISSPSTSSALTPSTLTRLFFCRYAYFFSLHCRSDLGSSSSAARATAARTDATLSGRDQRLGGVRAGRGGRHQAPRCFLAALAFTTGSSWLWTASESDHGEREFAKGEPLLLLCRRSGLPGHDQWRLALQVADPLPSPCSPLVQPWDVLSRTSVSLAASSSRTRT